MNERTMPAAEPARSAAPTTTDPAPEALSFPAGAGSNPTCDHRWLDEAWDLSAVSCVDCGETRDFTSATPARGAGDVKEAASPVYRDPFYTVLEKLVIPAVEAMLSGRAWNECLPECTKEQHFWACRFAPTPSNEGIREHTLRGERGFASW